MEVGFVTEAQMPLFSSLLLPAVAAGITQGEPITVLGLVDEGVACGGLAGYADGGTFHILCLYVASDYRRRGGGTLLVKTLSKLLSGEGDMANLEISYTATQPEHQSLAPFLQRLMFDSVANREHNIYMTNLEEVAKSPFFAQAGGQSSEIQPFAQIPRLLLKTVEQKLRAGDIPLPEQSLVSGGIDQEISMAYIKNGEILALVVFEHQAGGPLTLASAWSGAEPAVMSHLFLAAFGAAVGRYPKETILLVQSIKAISHALLARILPSAKAISHNYIRAVDGI